MKNLLLLLTFITPLAVFAQNEIFPNDYLGKTQEEIKYLLRSQVAVTFKQSKTHYAITADLPLPIFSKATYLFDFKSKLCTRCIVSISPFEVSTQSIGAIYDFLKTSDFIKKGKLWVGKNGHTYTIEKDDPTIFLIVINYK